MQIERNTKGKLVFLCISEMQPTFEASLKGSANRAKCQTNCYLFAFPNRWSSKRHQACSNGRVVTEVDMVKCSPLGSAAFIKRKRLKESSRLVSKVRFFLHIPILFAIYLTDSYFFSVQKVIIFLLQNLTFFSCMWSFHPRNMIFSKNHERLI